MTRQMLKFCTSAAAAMVCIIVCTQTTHASSGNEQQLNVPQGSDASLNWSGYVAGGTRSGDSYTSVTGSWVVPKVGGTDRNSADATWVGIGGVSSRDLIQAGTQALVQGGTVAYSAWIETLPGFSKGVPLEVQSGDSITTTLTEETPGTWSVTIVDHTRGTSYSQSVAYNSSRSSADWVEEMVSNGSASFIPLDSFGSVAFTGAAATVNGASKNLSQLGAKPLTMTSLEGQTLATASTLGNDNASFSVARSTAPATPMAEQYYYYDSGEGVPVTVVVHRHHAHSNGAYSMVGVPFTISLSNF